MLWVHGLLSALDPAWAIDESEARALSAAWVNYFRHTDIGDSIDPKTAALFAALGLTAAMEGPRLIRVMGARKARRQATRDAETMAQQAGGRVVDMAARPYQQGPYSPPFGGPAP